MTPKGAAWRRLQEGTLQVKLLNREPWAVVYSTKCSWGHSCKPKRLRMDFTPNGYPRVRVRYGGVKYAMLLHVLVWMWHKQEMVDEEDEIDHRDQDKTNCRPDNLLRTDKAGNTLRRNARNGWNGTTTMHMTEAEREAHYVAIYGEF